MSDSSLNELRQQEIAEARIHLISIGKNPDQLDDFVDLLSLNTEKRTLEAALAVLDCPVHMELIERLSPLIAHPDIGIRISAFSRVAVIIDAMRSSKWDFVEYLLDQGIDLNRSNYYGSSTFSTACCGIAPPEWVKRMIDLGADVNRRGRGGETPIFSAARGKAIEVMELLLAQGGDINACNDENKTPLISSAQGGRLESVKWLIEHGADVSHIEGRGRDALYWAKENKRAEIGELLIRALDRG